MRITVCAANIDTTLLQLFQSSQKGEERVFINNLRVRITKIFEDFWGELCKIKKGKTYYLKDRLQNFILNLNIFVNIQNRLIKFISKLGSFQNKRRRKINKITRKQK